MANQFSQEVLRACVGHVCQAIGYQGIYATPLAVLTDLLHRYLSELCRLTHRYTEHFGRTEPTLDDLGLAFMDMGISVPDLEEYINNVDCSPFPHPLPALPVPRPSNLNFLKPGSREILSRPIHIHEHLPPMYPEKEEEEVDVKVGGGLDDVAVEGASPSVSPQPAVKRPADSDVSPAKKPKFSLDDEGQPVREIVSVMMTTSGFISSAREGKLPEARCPDIPMALPRCTSPSTIGKKKMTVEKLIRQKNSQFGGGGPRAGPVRPPRPKLKTGGKDRMNGKGLKLPKFQPRPISLPKGGPPGSSPLPPKLKMPLLKPPTPKPPKVSSPKGPILPKTPNTPKVTPIKTGQPPGSTPKTSTPKIKVPKPPRPPKGEGKKSGTNQAKGDKVEKDKDKDKEKEKEKEKEKDKEGEGNSSKKVKKEKDGNKKEGKKEGSKKEGKKEGKKDVRKDKEGRKEGSKKETKKEKEIKKERERERELIMALQSSSAVTVTSIPAPSKPPEGPPPPGPEKAEGKSKLSIFKKINKTKDAKEERDAPGSTSGPASAQPSRDSSPDLMIDETPGRGQRRPPEEPPPEAPTPVHVEVTPDVIAPPRSPGDYTPYHEDLSPPTTPSTPRTPELPPHLPPHRPNEKRRGRDKGRERRPRKDRSKSPKGGPFSPGARDGGDPEPPERPKTPEGGLPMEDMGGGPGAPFLPAFPTAPGFIPPFSRFPFLPPFGGPPPRPGLAPPIPDLRLPPHHHFLPRPPLKRPLEEDPLCPVEDNEPLERPPTPRHPREGSPLMMRGHGSPMRSPSPSTPPRPRTPAHHSPPPQPLPRPHPRTEKPEKADKEKKKEHKKEKKEKEKEKEKGKKKKDKKDKEKEKDKADKKKEKEKTKQEKKEKKVKREKEDGGPRITMKLTSSLPSPSSSSGPDAPVPTTPKLVIKPVVKHDENPPPPPQPPPPPPPSSQDDQPGSPKIEIAKFSALITRPPRSSQQKRAESPPALPVLKIKDVPNPMTKHKEGKESGHTPAKVKEVPPLKIKNPTPASNKPSSSKVSPPTPKQSVAKLPTSPKAATAAGPKPPVVPKVIEEKKSPGAKKPKEKKEKKEKKMKDISPPTPNPLVGSISKPGPAVGGSGGGGGEAPYPSHSPMPIVSPPLESPKPSKKQEQKSTGLLTETVGPIGHFVDDQGNEVWICPTCGKQDDGSPMIGCDTCDDWYHWVCVGIQVPPNDDVNWYCNRCLSQHKQRGAPPEKKKRGRKKK